MSATYTAKSFGVLSIMAAIRTGSPVQRLEADDDRKSACETDFGLSKFVLYARKVK
jgi:hypothetical protein